MFRNLKNELLICLVIVHLWISSSTLPTAMRCLGKLTSERKFSFEELASTFNVLLVFVTLSIVFLAIIVYGFAVR